MTAMHEAPCRRASELLWRLIDFLLLYGQNAWIAAQNDMCYVILRCRETDARACSRRRLCHPTSESLLLGYGNEALQAVARMPGLLLAREAKQGETLRCEDIEEIVGYPEIFAGRRIGPAFVQSVLPVAGVLHAIQHLRPFAFNCCCFWL